jgi:4-hydroxy 2-oxovalerate aldolase
VFATARYVAYFDGIAADKYYCLVGNEAKRLARNTAGRQLSGKCILPPYPRMMGTDVPDNAEQITYELSSVRFAGDFIDSCTTIALQLALDISSASIYTVGYDGYPGSILSEKEMALTVENRAIFDSYASFTSSKLKSLTPSLYRGLDVESLYQYI